MMKRAAFFALMLNFVVLTVTCAQAPSTPNVQSSSQSKTPVKNDAAKDATPAAACPAVPSSNAAAVREVNADQLQKLLRRNGTATHPLLINFWATWCVPCREEFPDLVKINNESRQRGLDFFLISLDDIADIKTKVPDFLGEMKATTIPTFLLNTPDPEVAINAVDPQWSGSLPATFLFDASGKIIYKHTGRINPDELRKAISQAIGDK